MSREAVHTNPYRWVVLGVFLLVAGLSQAVWLNFAPLVTTVEARWGVSESEAGLLLLVFPLLYVLLSIPAGLLTDRKGYRYALRLASAGMAAFSLLRIVDGGFWLMLTAQTGLAIFQPFAVNAISKLVLDWFDLEQGALATGLGTMGMFIGMALGMAATPPMVEAWGIPMTMAAWAAAAVGICGACFALVKENPAAAGPPPAEIGVVDGLRPLLANRALVLLFGVALLGLGYFNGLTAWIEPLLAPNGLDSVKAGIVGGVLILGGIVGAVAIPALSDRFKRRKPFVLGSVVAAFLTLWPMVESRDYTTVLVASALQGFFFLPAFALLLEICSELAGEALAGSATGVLMLAGNGGGVLVIVAMVSLQEGLGSWQPSVWLLLGLLALAGAGAAFLPETYHRRVATLAA
jgi:predicted MFS family arabinose efflux permease